MSVRRPLRGSCSCGRNNYIITVPENATDSAHVFFDSSSENRLAQAAPVTAWLHIPLIWFQSHTTSFFPDETHSMIRKIFTPASEPQSKRVFCGYCGTHLTYWTEAAEDDADYLDVTVGSLFGEDLRSLAEIGLLPGDVNEDDLIGEHQESPVESAITTNVTRHDESVRRMVRRRIEGDMTWIEEMIDGSKLGRLQKTKKSMGKSADGKTFVEWEITEIADNGSEHEPGAGRGKRKLGEIAAGENAEMRL